LWTPRGVQVHHQSEKKRERIECQKTTKQSHNNSGDDAMADEALVTIEKNVETIGRKKLAAAALLYLSDTDASLEPSDSNIGTWLNERLTRDAIKSIVVATGAVCDAEVHTVNQAIGKIDRMMIHTLVGVFPDQTPEVALGRSIVSAALRAVIGKLSARALTCLCPDRACKTNKAKIENICLKLFPGLCITTWDMSGKVPLQLSAKKGSKDEVDEETDEESDDESDDDADDRDYHAPTDGEAEAEAEDDEVIPVEEEEEGVLDDVVEGEGEGEDDEEAEDEERGVEKDEKPAKEETEDEEEDKTEELSEPVKKKPKKSPESAPEKHHHHHHHHKGK
jgi:hypothetical protein